MWYAGEKRKRVVKEFTKPSRTQQHEKQNCDINFIMQKYQKHGIVTHVQKHQGFYADVTNLPDYQESLHVVMRANEMFMSLPSSIRSKFDNDPAAYLAFVSDPRNRDQLVEWGIIEAPSAPPAPVEVRVVNPEPQEPN